MSDVIEVPNEEGQKAPSHVATYTRDKKGGGYLVRVTGPRARDCSGLEVPVLTKKGDVHKEKLMVLVWWGIDDLDFDGHPATSLPVALYTFEKKARAEEPVDVHVW
jgi:hypothetical protein